MTFLLRVDGQKWHANLDAVLGKYDDTATGGRVIPVIKGNGYGLGQGLLAGQMARRGRDCVSVGTVFEALDPEFQWDGDLLVLTPWQVADEPSQEAWAAARERYGDRLITSVGDIASLRAIAAEGPRRILFEGLTSVARFGFTAEQAGAALADPAVRGAMADGGLRIEGLALHLPMVAPDIPADVTSRMLGPAPVSAPVIDGSGKVQQAAGWALHWLAILDRADAPEAAVSGAAALWVSHLSDSEVADVRRVVPGVPVNPRIGTALWLGDLSSMQAYGVVQAVHTGELGGVGYFQKRLPKGRSLAIIGGGTTHGVALSAPIGAATAKRRVTNLGTTLLETVGRTVSPYRWQGQRLWFAETPHASVSLIQIPKGMEPPPVGTEVACQIRQTTARFDRVIGID